MFQFLLLVELLGVQREKHLSFCERHSWPVWMYVCLVQSKLCSWHFHLLPGQLCWREWKGCLPVQLPYLWLCLGGRLLMAVSWWEGECPSTPAVNLHLLMPLNTYTGVWSASREENNLFSINSLDQSSSCFKQHIKCITADSQLEFLFIPLLSCHRFSGNAGET